MMLEGRHADTAEPKVKHKSGWSFQDFHFIVEGDAFKEGICIRACDLEHALKQAKSWGKKAGFTVIRLK